MATYTFGNKADAVLAAKIARVLVGDDPHYQPITTRLEWTLSVPNVAHDTLAHIADSIRN